MGEYLKYKEDEVKIGTCESLYYVTYQKYMQALQRGYLAALDTTSPAEYAKPDSGFRFRFPFPDEDKLSFGDILEPFNRSVLVTISNEVIPYDEESPGTVKLFYQMEITAQKLIHRESDGQLVLALVWHDPLKNLSYRVEDDANVAKIVQQIEVNNISNETDQGKKEFYRQITDRILDGYRPDIISIDNKQQHRAKAKRQEVNKIIPFPKPPRKRRGKGL